MNRVDKLREDIIAIYRRGEVGVSETLAAAASEVGDQMVARLFARGKDRQ
jgi:hypothetical protein